jgi:P22 coat protein - gene protein 5
MITAELLDCFENNLVFCKGIMRQYSSEFAVPGNKIGPTLNIRLPAQLRTTSGPNLQVQDYVEQSVPLTIDQQEHVDLQFSSFEMTLSLDDWRRRIGRPSGIVLANKVDAYGLSMYWAIPNAIISPPSSPTNSKWKAYLQAGAILADNGTPEDGSWRAILNQWEQVEVVNELKGLFQSSEQIKRQYERGLMGESGGLTWAWDQNVAVHTSGPAGGAPLFQTVVAGGASITVSGFSTAAALRLNKGDIFTIANTNAVNPVSLASTGKPRQFTVTANVNSAADGTATIPIYPPIIGPATPANPRQTVAALPIAAAPLTLLMTPNTAYYQNICHQEQAYGMAMCRLQEPFSGQSAYAVDSDTGVAVRTWKASDISTDMHASRADIAFGFAVTRPQWACRVVSTVSGT